MNRSELALEAMKAALRVRRDLLVGSTDAVQVYDAARKRGLEVRFVDVPTLEGMYVGGHRPTILITSHRPAGRQAMTCAHEIAHHEFGHGSRIDEVLSGEKVQSTTADEFLAHTFAANFLMTRGAVAQAFLARGISATDPQPEQILIVANWLGVGYSALIYHARSALHMIPRSAADKLLKVTPKKIRLEMAERLGLPVIAGSLIIVDPQWKGRPIDVQVGDTVVVPEGSRFEDSCGILRARALELVSPGIGRVFHPALNWAAYVRVSRCGYTGLAEYRHLEEAEDDPSVVAPSKAGTSINSGPAGEVKSPGSGEDDR